MDNSFKKEHRVRCFNHTLQLSAKSLLRPFNTALSGKDTDGDDGITAQDHEDDQGLLAINEEEDWGDEQEPDLEDLKDDIDDEDHDELRALSEDEQERVLEETAVVRETVTKVRYHCTHSANSLIIYRYDNFHSLSSVQLQSLSLLGAASAVSSISRKGLSLVML
jgi:hypothetical protein